MRATPQGGSLLFCGLLEGDSTESTQKPHGVGEVRAPDDHDHVDRVEVLFAPKAGRLVLGLIAVKFILTIVKFIFVTEKLSFAVTMTGSESCLLARVVSSVATGATGCLAGASAQWWWSGPSSEG